MVDFYLMGLNIKNRDTFRLAHELSELTGESVTTAVTESIRERLERLRESQPSRLAERMLAVGRDCAARLPPSTRSLDHADLLYGPDGLPR